MYSVHSIQLSAGHELRHKIRDVHTRCLAIGLMLVLADSAEESNEPQIYYRYLSREAWLLVCNHTYLIKRRLLSAAQYRPTVPCTVDGTEKVIINIKY